tara:strand:- start:230 stop:349 length:120 start_codon:yes stop_codon:yes gene_type:complete
MALNALTPNSIHSVILKESKRLAFFDAGQAMANCVLKYE